MTEYLYFQTIVQFRVPVDGGNPEVIKKFTTEIRGKNPMKKKKHKPVETKESGVVTL